MEHKKLLECASELVAARQATTTIEAPSTRDEGLSMADAYVIAGLVHDEWARADHQANGVKIGLTNQAMWPALGINAPMWGRTYAETTVEGPTNMVSIDACVAPRLEAEVVVGLARTLEPGASATEVAEAIDWAALGFELVDAHVADWKVKPADLVADFGAHAGLVIGSRRRLSQTELVGLEQMTLELSNGAGSSLPGRGDAVLGGPVPAIVAHLAGPWAPTLGAGSVVSTGSLTGAAHPIAAGEEWCLAPASGPLPGVALTVSGTGLER